MTHPSHFCSRREFLTMAGATTAGIGLAAGAEAVALEPAIPRAKSGQRRLFGLRFPPMDKVRIGFIGVGSRGSSLLGNLLDVDGVEIKAVCDLVPDRVKSAQQRVVAKRQPEPAGYVKGETAFEALCRRDDLDLVYIAGRRVLVPPWLPQQYHHQQHHYRADGLPL